MRSGFSSILAALGLLVSIRSANSVQTAGPASGASPRRASKARGKGAINHAARAARSHAGKPADYVKAY